MNQNKRCDQNKRKDINPSEYTYEISWKKQSGELETKIRVNK